MRAGWLLLLCLGCTPLLCLGCTPLLCLGCTPPLTIAVAGDVFPGEMSFSDTQIEALRAADLAIVNLETPLSEAAFVPCPPALGRRCLRFRSGAHGAQRLAEAGVDVAVLANNHALDAGPQGLADTQAALRAAGIESVVKAPIVLMRGGRRIGLLAATLVPPPAVPRFAEHVRFVPWRTAVRTLVEAVEALALRTDVVVVSLHWGQEGAAAPTPRQRRLGKALAKAGAHLVFGHHAHRVQGQERVGRTQILYGLGDAVRAGHDPGPVRMVRID